MVAVKLPFPLPTGILLSERVGLDVVLKQIPLSVTGLPPSLVIFPPETAEVVVMEEAVVVVMEGSKMDNVVKLISFP